MKLQYKAPGRLPKTELVVLFLAEGKKLALPDGVSVPARFQRDVSSEPRKVLGTYAEAGPAVRVLAIGLGPAKKVDAESFRRGAALAVKIGESAEAASATIVVSDEQAKLAGGAATVGRAVAEGALMGSYQYTGGKSEAKTPKLKTVTVVGAGTAFKGGVEQGVVCAEANRFARDLQNPPGNRMRPRDLAAAARKLAARSPRLRCKILDEREMERLGMGLLLSVSQGSTEPARLVHLSYRPARRARGKVALVGKGLTFDAGGISLKPSAKMDDMRFDMSGGAAVLGVFHALASIDVPWEVHGIVPCSENLPDGKATKPGDLFTAMNGKTVEVLNTDAEGRLILADALAYVEEKVDPDTIIDLATLTGAVVVALGHELSGMFASTERLRDDLTAAGMATGERVWPLPLLDVHKDFLKGVVADLRNISTPDMGAGSTAGAAFLSNFVDERTEWCHLDIAGTAWGGVQRDWVGGPQGSGVGTRLLIEYLETRR